MTFRTALEDAGAGGMPPLALVFAAALLIAPFVAMLAPMGMTAAMLATAAAALAAVLLTRPVAQRSVDPVVLLVLPLLLWAAASALWSLDPGLSLKRIGKLAGIFAAAALLVSIIRLYPLASRGAMGRVLLVALAGMQMLAAVEVLFRAPVARMLGLADWANLVAYNRGASLLSMLYFLVIYQIAVQRGGFRLLAIVSSVTIPVLLLAMESETAKAAILIGGTVLGLAVLFGRRVGWVMAAAFLAGCAAAPYLAARLDGWMGLTLDGPIPSIAHRLRIWSFVAERIAERPILGWGLDVARALPGGHAGAYVERATLEVLPLHPHNVLLQWWVELGLVGVVLAAAAVVGVILRQGRDAGGFLLASRYATLAAVLAFFTTGYGIWQTWWLAAMILVAAFAMLCLRPAAEPSTPGGRS